jgi:hypothetical protein
MRLGLLTNVTYSARKERSTPVQSAAAVLPTRDSPNQATAVQAVALAPHTKHTNLSYLEAALQTVGMSDLSLLLQALQMARSLMLLHVTLT